MKSATVISILLAGALAASDAALARGPGGPGFQQGNAVAVAYAPATAEEAATLLWMREEEKLARDVYLGLYDKWQDPVFAAIARSEQRHFDALGAKITLFGLADPALPGIGEFANGDLFALYGSLLATGSQSYGQALTVGATIEDLDIRDLLAALDATANPALRTVYGHLLEASKNHLRAFVARLETLGIDYQPQYIDPLLFDAIVGR